MLQELVPHTHTKWDDHCTKDMYRERKRESRWVDMSLDVEG